jgi:hypothetical protein
MRIAIQEVEGTLSLTLPWERIWKELPEYRQGRARDRALCHIADSVEKEESCA